MSLGVIAFAIPIAIYFIFLFVGKSAHPDH
jgi:hypothetical protein